MKFLCPHCGYRTISLFGVVKNMFQGNTIACRHCHGYSTFQRWLFLAVPLPFVVASVWAIFWCQFEHVGEYVQQGSLLWCGVIFLAVPLRKSETSRILPLPGEK